MSFFVVISKFLFMHWGLFFLCYFASIFFVGTKKKTLFCYYFEAFFCSSFFMRSFALILKVRIVTFFSCTILLLSQNSNFCNNFFNNLLLLC
jgi:hypothetical protein